MWNACKEIYEKSLTQLNGNERLKKEFDKLLLAAEKSAESHSRLTNRRMDIESEIKQVEESIRTHKTEAENQQTMKSNLLSTIQTTVKSKEDQKREQFDIRSRTEQLKNQIDQLENNLKHGSGWTQEQEKKMAQYRSKLADLEHLLEQKQTSLESIRQDIDLLLEETNQSVTQKLAVDTQIDDCEGQIEDKEKESERAQNRRDKVDTELRNLKQNVESYQTSYTEKEQILAEGESEIRKLENKLKGAKARMEQYLGEYDKLFQHTHKLTDSLDDQARANAYLNDELAQRRSETEIKGNEFIRVQQEMEQIKRMQTLVIKKIAEQEALHEKSEVKRLELREQQKVVERQIKVTRKENESLLKQVEDLSREREILSKNVVKAGEKTKNIHDLIAVYSNTASNLMNEVDCYKSEALEDRQAIESLEQDVTNYDNQVTAEKQKYLNAVEEVKLQDSRILELQKRVIEGESKLKQQQNLYEAVRSDRNVYSKNLIDAQKEISEMKRKFKIMNHQIEQLKDEITTKDHTLVKEHFDHHKVEKEKEIIKNELVKLRKQTQSTGQIIGKQHVEMKKLSQIIRDAEEEKTRQEKEFIAITNERDILGTQLIRRNEELKSLYEKIKVQMSSLRLGQNQFEEQTAKLHNYSKTINEVKAQQQIAVSQISSLGQLESQVIQLEKEIAQERAKVKALSDEMERPLNVHRWRQLEGSDPHRFAMIRKIQGLQVRLIKKSEEVALKTVQIEEKEKLYIELKNILARKPGLEVAEQLIIYQHNLKDKQRQIKEMNAQLQAFRAQVNEFKFEIESTNKQLKQLNKQYVIKKKSEMQGRDSESSSEEEEEESYISDLDDLQS